MAKYHFKQVINNINVIKNEILKSWASYYNTLRRAQYHFYGIPTKKHNLNLIMRKLYQIEGLYIKHMA